MVRLTADLIEQSAQYTNPVRDRELDLRGNYCSFLTISKIFFGSHQASFTH